MALKRVVFIRSGETDWNLNGRWQGWVASPLNTLGRQQMERLANFIRHIGLTKLYSSDHRRARESAEILAQSLGFDPTYDERLRERSIGYFQGLTVPEIHGWYRDEYRQLLQNPENYRVPGGESIMDVNERAKSFFEDLTKSEQDNPANVTVGVLSHTSTINLMIKYMVPDQDMTNMSFANSSVTTLLKTTEGAWRLVTVNDLSHLEGLESRFMPPDPRGDDVR
jgi:broad specificity phosphatase PhoE